LGPVWFIELAAAVDRNSVDSSVAVAMGVAGGGGSAFSAVAAAIGNRHVLLLLDNCEHVLDAAAAMVDELTVACAELRILATSREPLSVEGEHVVALRSLDPAGSGAELFRERAEAAGAILDAGEQDLIETICRRLDGIPLAIELAATRVAALGLLAIRDGLDDRFVLLSGGRRRSVERHQTLRAAVDWSYRLLPAVQQRLFRMLSVFSGGFEFDAVRDVHALLDRSDHDHDHDHDDDDHNHDHDHDIAQLLASLVDRNMVVAEAVSHSVRYRLLETLRAFALEELDQNSETDLVVSAHGIWVASITDTNHVAWMTADVMNRTLRLEREVESWRDALGSATRRRDLELVARLCGTATTYLLLGRPDLTANLVNAIDLFSPTDPRRAHLALVAGSAAMARLDVNEMRFWRDMAIEAGAKNDESGVFDNLVSLIALLDGDVVKCVQQRTLAMSKPDLPKGAHDFFLSTSLFWAISFGHPELVQDGWIEKAEEIVAHSDVPIIRYNARFGLAWASIATAPERSAAWGQEAISEINMLPCFFRQTSRAGAIRFLINHSPQISAATALDALPPPGRSGSTLEPLLAATIATLLDRSSHPVADDAISTLSRTTAATWMQLTLPDLTARRDRGNVVALDELIDRMRDALTQIATQTGT
jgi:predicted ATPase